MSIHSTSPAASSRGARREREHRLAGDAERTVGDRRAASPGTPGRRCSTSRRARRSRAGTRPTGRWRARRARDRARTVRIARSLIACAWRMHSSSSRVFVSLAGREHGAARRRTSRPRERVPQRERRVVEREPPGRQLGDELGRAVGGLDLDRGVEVVVGELRAANLRGTRCRGAATGRRARSRRPRATTTARMWSDAGTRAPVAYETFAWLHSTSVSMPAAAIAACSLSTRSRRMRARSSVHTGLVMAATLLSRARGWRSEVCRYTATRVMRPSAVSNTTASYVSRRASPSSTVSRSSTVTTPPSTSTRSTSS